jgi:NAD(P)-dependent dehydrogenase (short-subunit alcohol dehydrogenase family)
MAAPHTGELAGRVAVITGGGGELGRALAEGFTHAGARVALLDVEPALSRARRWARTLEDQALALRCDITRENEVRRAFAAVARRWRRLDFVLNNAGIEGPTTPAAKISRRQWEQTLAVNLTGAFLCAREAARRMKRGGGIIQIGSVAGRIAYPLRLPYAVSKCALEGLTRTLAAELGPQNIRVNLVAPGPIAGERMERVIRQRARATGRSAEAVRASYLEATTLKKMVDPENVVRTVLFLCARGTYLSGQTIEVSSGWVGGRL